MSCFKLYDERSMAPLSVVAADLPLCKALPWDSGGALSRGTARRHHKAVQLAAEQRVSRACVPKAMACLPVAC